MKLPSTVACPEYFFCVFYITFVVLVYLIVLFVC
jgi:hypothetical protein